MDRISGVTLTDGARFTIRQLLWYARDHGRAYPSVDTLAVRIGRSVRQVQRYLRELENCGLIRRFKRIWRGKQSSNGFLFLWVESLFGDAVSPKATTQKLTQTQNTTNVDELLPRPAQRGPSPADSPNLGVLRDAIQQIHERLPGGSARSVGRASNRTASWFRHRVSQALGRKASTDEVVKRVRDHEFFGYLERLGRRRKVPMTISGICEYLYNWLAPEERQTVDYRPENELPVSEYKWERPAISVDALGEIEEGTV